MSKTIESILNEFREAATSSRNLGDKFERLIASVLKIDSSLTSVKYSKVWLWNEWPHNDKQPDTGIDIVAQEEISGEYVAIQCKFYNSDHNLTKEDIDSFFTASGKGFKTKEGPKRFSHRIIISTTDLWSKHALKALENQSPPAIKIGIQDLLNCSIDWDLFDPNKVENIKARPKKDLRPHQKEALEKVEQGFKSHSRGKLIMACGTGKTFTSLKIVEQLVPSGGQVLFLVPSIALLSQTLKEWMIETEKPLNCFAVCSDSRVGKNEDMSISDLSFPATTDTKALLEKIKTTKSKNNLTIIFSTYQSIQVVSDAQSHGLSEFDLVICDEAHRTTGTTFEGEDASVFQKVHDETILKAKKRLYMTATPRLYSEAARAQAAESSIRICDMDSVESFGPEFHNLGFSQAVSRGLLVDYKVLVLGVDEKYISRAFQSQLTDDNNELELEDAVKIVGCWNGLAKKIDSIAKTEKTNPMKRAVAFSSTIKSSKHIKNLFSSVVETHIQRTKDENALLCEIDHVDGSMNVMDRNKKLAWLKEEPGENTCRILTNARCLSEGVDVPSLDAVMFLTPRNSIVDVVQSVGRVMRKSPGKDYGYIILPIGIPSDMSPEDALDNNDKYRIVWQVLNALRAHDDRFDAIINKIKLNDGTGSDSPIHTGFIGDGNPEDENGETVDGQPRQSDFVLEFPHLEEWKNAIYAKLVQKCGSRIYWEEWAKKVAVQAEVQRSRIQKILSKPSPEHKKAFESFLDGLHQNINPSIKKEDAVEMLAQHLVTRPVFEALFENYSFSKSNPISVAMQSIVDLLDRSSTQSSDKEMETFYSEVRNKVSGVNNFEGKQQIIKELYDKFFNHAFPKLADRLGIVYTPLEIVDFINKSVNEVLNQEFGRSIGDEGVHVLDPFTGTGTFIVRLIQSGLITKDDIVRKFTKELHANEIVLLAYYIATINIEEAFHYITGSNYTSFEGALLTDTFQMYENDGSFDDLILGENSKRLKKQKDSPISVIIGNPPYSSGQSSENDNNQNLRYTKVDESIRVTYAQESTATLKNSLYDSYIRAIRWSSNRIKEKGVIAFVTNGSFIEGNAADGLRKSLTNEFSKIYCFNLRGNQKKSDWKKEGGKIFGSGSQNTIAITILVKDTERIGTCDLFYYDIGDYLSKEEKLEAINGFGSVGKIPWQQLRPNKEGDWINHRDEAYEKFLVLGNKKLDKVDDESNGSKLFVTYSSGVKTNRDAWVYNYSKEVAHEKVNNLLEFYNLELDRYSKACEGKNKKDFPGVNSFIDLNPHKISWTRELKEDFAKLKRILFNKKAFVNSMYRPYCKQVLYFNRSLNNCVYLMPSLFPTPSHDNIVISCSGIGSSKGFSSLACNLVTDLQVNFNGQCFPLYFYKEEKGKFLKEDAITDFALNSFHLKYDSKISKEDIFYYVYGLLHSNEYKERFESDLKKMLPKIPFCKEFWPFSKAGRELADLHLNYETVKPYELLEVLSQTATTPKKFYKVQKMKFSTREDKSTIVYNGNITLKGIPLCAYDYVVNGKSAIEWVMERYQVDVDKKSGIVNDPNEYSQDPRYIIDLVKRIVTVSIESVRIVNSLPALDEIVE